MESVDMQCFHKLVDARIASTRARLEASAIRINELTEARSGTVEDDEHDPEGTTISQNRALEVQLHDDAERALTDLQQAQTRLAEGTYDVCGNCGGPIALERLEVRPETRFCIGCAAGRHRR